MNHQWGFLVLTVIAGCVLAYDDVIAEQTADDDAELLVEEDDTIEVRVDVATVCRCCHFRRRCSYRYGRSDASGRKERIAICTYDCGQCKRT